MDLDTDKADILAVIKTIDQAHYCKDAVAAEYAEDAVVADRAPPLRHVGMDPAYGAEWFKTWVGPVERLSHDFTIDVSGDLAVCHGFYQLAGAPKAAGDQRISFWMCATVCMRRIAGKWKIVHKHESVRPTWTTPSGPPSI